MKQLYFLMLLVFTLFANGQIINFPDANFKAKLFHPNVARDNFYQPITIDANNDGEIEMSEVADVVFLDVPNSNISDLTGINYFVNLRFLHCSNNSLVNLTISNTIILMELTANNNELTTVNVNFGNSNMEYDPILDLSNNNLSMFSVSNALFYEVNLSNNQLTSLSVNNCSVYGGFYVNNNNLASIQFSGGCSIGGYVNFRNNQFTLLDLSGAGIDPTSIVYLGNNIEDRINNVGGNIVYSSNNTFFDLGNYRNVTGCEPEQTGHVTISNSPNLKNVILKNGFNHITITCDEGGDVFQNQALSLSISNCPNLSFICVDEGERPNIQAKITQLGLQNQVQVNSYCSFTPGGTFYTVNGSTQFDSNGNGCDAGDFAIPNQQFTISNGTETGTIISDASGNYVLNVGQGTHTITPIIQNPTGFIVSPSNSVVNFPSQNSPITQNFCIAAGTPLHDFEITLIPLNPAVPGFDSNYKIVYKNTGNTIDSGTIILNFPDAVLDFVSASILPITNSGGTLNWSFDNLMPFEIRTINLTFNLNQPMETPPLNGGDVLHFTTSIAESGVVQPFPNNHLLNQMLVNSFDPNDKICLEGETLGTDFIGGYVSYKIRFENTGTFPAQNIVVKDIIDMSKFDITTLTAVIGSHNFYTRIAGNKVEFIFENINLPFDDASNDGYVVFKIKLLPSVTQGINFSNQANIYFDYNFPIITNTTNSVIENLGVTSFDFENQFTIFPVPTTNVLQLISKDNLEISDIELYNSMGQIIQKAIGNQQSIDVSNLSKGSYYLKIKTENLTFVKQFLKD
ncbi:T9SS type A sorting domain-containing protein [Flavobacterium sp.]|uniref:DUF7619 domain-containing protein n=1 Tax=Flavobacterium sp. TaxID=239 RepID=UPI003919E317